MSVLEYEREDGETCKNQFKRVLGELLLSLASIKGVNQTELSKTLECSAPRVNDLCKGKFEKFSCDWLYERICLLGYVPEIKFDTNKGWHGGVLSVDFRNKGEQFELNIAAPEDPKC